jgi:hypothetical protein
MMCKSSTRLTYLFLTYKKKNILLFCSLGNDKDNFLAQLFFYAVFFYKQNKNKKVYEAIIFHVVLFLFIKKWYFSS